MRYVSDIIDDGFSHVYYSRIEDIFGFSITDDESKETVRYDMQGTESLITKKLMKEFSETVYGFDIVHGLWLTRPCDLQLYEIIDFYREYDGVCNCIINLKAPYDKTGTLMQNYDRFAGSNPVFTIAGVVFRHFSHDLLYFDVVEIKDDIIKISFKASNKVIEYKILDRKKFDILLTKYITLRR